MRDGKTLLRCQCGNSCEKDNNTSWMEGEQTTGDGVYDIPSFLTCWLTLDPCRTFFKCPDVVHSVLVSEKKVVSSQYRLKMGFEQLTRHSRTFMDCTSSLQSTAMSIDVERGLREQVAGGECGDAERDMGWARDATAGQGTALQRKGREGMANDEREGLKSGG